MPKTSAISFVHDSRGRKRKMIIDLTKINEELQDLIDGIVSELRLKETSKDASKVFNRLDKKFKLKPAGIRK